MINPATLIDGYKCGHKDQYPEHTETVYSNFTPRKSRTRFNYILPLGIQYFVKKYLIQEWNDNFFNILKHKAVKRAKRRLDNYLGTDMNVDHLNQLHDLGYLPLEVKAVEEGTLIPIKIPLFTIVNTHKDFGWLPNYFETIASCINWMPTTSATTAFCFRRLLNQAALETVGNTDFVPFQGHDFSFRGMPGLEAAVTSGAGHLLSFVGTDTIPAIDFLEDYYGADCEKELIGCSVNATEHSVMCAGGCEDADEYNTYHRLITKVYPKGIISIVSDTWDYWNVLTNILPQLKNDIMSRDGKVVIRPDSGDSVKVICGYRIFEAENNETFDTEFWEGPVGGAEVLKYRGNYFLINWEAPENKRVAEPMSEAEVKGTIELLWDLFGGTISEKGYKMLDQHIGAILGDGVTLAVADEIITRLKEKGFASTNLVFGIGSYTYQYVTRDTYFMAMKATYCVINGVAKNIFKDPKTDKKQDKKSAKGLLCVECNEGGNIILRDGVTWEEENNSLLTTVFKNGKLIRETTLAKMRANVNCALNNSLVESDLKIK